ncbi:hypothetical protein [Anaerovibrio sp.]|uniref:hypothetical protein n=1 Tax=Anaerovibrio sp. TaxID=1872532 RepID=UPI0038904850
MIRQRLPLLCKIAAMVMIMFFAGNIGINTGEASVWNRAFTYKGDVYSIDNFRTSIVDFQKSGKALVSWWRVEMEDGSYSIEKWAYKGNLARGTAKGCLLAVVKYNSVGESEESKTITDNPLEAEYQVVFPESIGEEKYRTAIQVYCDRRGLYQAEEISEVWK